MEKTVKQENRQSLRSNRKICIVSFVTNSIPSPSGEDNATRLSIAHTILKRTGYAQSATWKAIVTRSAVFDKEVKLTQSKYLNSKGRIPETPPRCLPRQKTQTLQKKGDNNSQRGKFRQGEWNSPRRSLTNPRHCTLP